MRRTGQVRMPAVLLAGVLAVSACAGGDDDVAQRIWVRSMNGDAMTNGLNVQLVSSLNARTFSAQILDPLIFVSDDSTLSPALAQSWEVSADGLDLTLRLREGVTWHDGQPFTAADVKFNFEEIVPLSTYGAALAERIESVEITDPTTVVVHLAQTYGPLLEAVAVQFMVPRHVYEGTDHVTNQANKEPIGTGPMKFADYTPGQEIVLEKNPAYWEGEVQVDRAVFTMIPDANSRAEALFSGEIDEAVLDVSQQGRVAENQDIALLEEGFFPEVVTMMFNARGEHFADPAVRAAVFAAIDRRAIAEVALASVGAPANGFFPEAQDWALNTDVDFDRDFPRDLDAINATLDRAGFPRGPDGTRFTLSMRFIASLTDTGATARWCGRCSPTSGSPQRRSARRARSSPRRSTRRRSSTWLSCAPAWARNPASGSPAGTRATSATPRRPTRRASATRRSTPPRTRPSPPPTGRCAARPTRTCRPAPPS
ncbi:hypothetical protein BJF90_36600 [Pseudonocardia sp. CNS-004]|nr:hypothetical protein BJF90_36600 [Pseudonocardia sp. CNS-004]